MKHISIVGAGMAGLLAANLLKRNIVSVYERQSSLPNNHSAVLRFRTSVVGDALGIPFRKVTLIKTSLPWRNPVADALAYSFKNTGNMRSDRSINAGEVVAERWIAPPDLIQQMFDALTSPRSDALVLFNQDFFHPADNVINLGEPTISTIPMPMLMKALEYPHQPEFNSVPGVNVRAKIAHCDAYISINIPDPAQMISRLSITGDEMIAEVIGGRAVGFDTSAMKDVVDSATEILGIGIGWLTDMRWSKQAYAKITPIPEEVRRDFIYWASHERNVYSLGRFATWRPSLLLDDIVKDVRLIEKWINSDDKYGLARAR